MFSRHTMVKKLTIAISPQEGYWFGDSNNTSVAGASCASCACGAGALAAACDARSGQCACKEGFAGRACDRCAEGHGGKC